MDIDENYQKFANSTSLKIVMNFFFFNFMKCNIHNIFRNKCWVLTCFLFSIWTHQYNYFFAINNKS